MQARDVHAATRVVVKIPLGGNGFIEPACFGAPKNLDDPIVGDGRGGQSVAIAAHKQSASGVVERASNGYGPLKTTVESERAGIVERTGHVYGREGVPIGQIL